MRLFFAFLSMHFKGQMQHKASFFLTVLGQFLSSFTAFLGVYFMFSRFHEVDGFTYPQILLCFAIMLMAFSLAEIFGRGFDTFPRMLSNGELDRALVRPKNIIFLVLIERIDFRRLGSLAQSVLVFAYAIPASGVIWSWDKAITLCLMVFCGSLLFMGLFLVYAALTFFTIEGLEFMNILTYGGFQFGRYPYVIYGEGLLRFLTYGIPLALVQYYPLLYLLDKKQGVLYMLTPLLGLLFLLPCYGFFQFGLRHYKSTGS